MHEGRGLLEEGRGYSTGVGGSCSMHNPWLVVPHPRGVGRLGVGAGRQPSVHSADINEPAAETASEDRWNTAVSSRCTTPVRVQCQHHGHRRPAGRMRRASAKPNRLARSILRSRGRGLKALCCLMTSESFGCHDISRHRSGVGLPDGRAAASACRRGVPRSLWWLPASSGRTAQGWDATGRGSGALRVGGAFVQYAQPLASGSRPSWSRPTRADSGRSRRRTMTTGTLCRQRAGSGGGGPMTEASGCAVGTPDSLLRGPVSTALT